MKIFNILFYFLVLIGFCLPTNSSFFLDFNNVKLEIRELAFIMLPFVNIFCFSNNKLYSSSKSLKIFIIIFAFSVISTEFFKHIYYSEGISAMFKTLRLGLPLFSSLFLLYSGINVSVKILWKVLLVAISFSAILTFLTPFVHLPIYGVQEGTNIIEALRGRFINANASFGFIGAYLLLDKDPKWYKEGFLFKFACILSIMILILTFNRTYLLILSLFLFFKLFSSISIKSFLKLTLIFTCIISIGIWTINQSERIERQFNTRILSVLSGNKSLSESIYNNNREQIYNGVLFQLSTNKWLFGVTYNQPIFTWKRKYDITPMTTTDTSFINILLRYGIIPFLLFNLILIYIYAKSKSKIVTFFIIVNIISSLNIDSLLRHNSIFFLTIIVLMTERFALTETYNRKVNE